MIGVQNEFRRILKNKFKEVTARNPNISQRGFAKMVGLAPSEISLVMNGKRVFGIGKILSVIEKLNLSEDASKKINILTSSDPNYKLYTMGESYESLDTLSFASLSDWYYFAILALADMEDTTGSVDYYAKRLGLEEEVAEKAITLMLDMKLLSVIEGRLVVRNTMLSSPNDKACPFILKNHKQHIKLAQECMDNDNVGDRDISGITVKFNRSRIQEAREVIRDFRRSMAELLDSEDSNEVYRLEVMLFPLTRPL